MPSIYSLGLLVLLIQFKITIVFSSASAISTTMEFGNHVIKAYQPNNITRDETSIQGSTSKADKLADKVNLPTALLDEKKRRIWCFGPNPESKRYYLPVRFLSTMRKMDVIILPGGHEPTKEFVDFMIPLLGLSEKQILYTSGKSFSLDKDIETEIQNQLQELIRNSERLDDDKKGCEWVLVPYSATQFFKQWSSVLSKEFSSPNDDLKSGKIKDSNRENSKISLEVFGESEEWIDVYGHKGILHRHMSDLLKKAVIEDIDLDMKKNSVPKGYQCSNNQHLLDAYILLQQETGINKAVIKPIFGTAGYGIIFISSAKELEDYDFPMGEVLLEEMLDLDLTDDGLIISPAVHYIGTELFGGRLVDQLMRNTTYLGWRESKANKNFQEKVLKMTEKLIQYTQPKGPGGYDFLSVNGEPLLSDINTGRFNGAHQPKLFLAQYAPPGANWYCWKHKPKASLTVDVVWAALKKGELAYSPVAYSSENVPQECSEGKLEGVFPLTYLRGIDGMFIAIADSSERAYEIYEKTKDILELLESKC